jgi:hypothetical protein
MSDYVLFIGGSADGQWLAKPTAEYWKIPKNETYRGLVLCDTYRRERLRSGNEEWECYVLESMTSQDFIERLINGYSSKAL